MSKTKLAALAATLQLINLSTVQPASADGETNAAERVPVDTAAPVEILVDAEQPVPYAEDVTAQAFDIPTVPLANECGEWYDRIEAKPGSRAYWIIYVARQTAKRGEDTTYLRRVLNDTLAKWYSVPCAAAPGGEATN